MSELTEAKDGQVYTDYSIAASPFCISLAGLNICYEANMESVGVALNVSVKIFPFPALRKFVIKDNGSFEWNFAPFMIQIKISNFKRNGGDYSFDGDFKIDALGISQKGSHHFENGRLLKAAAEPTDAEFTNMLILQLLMDKEIWAF